VEPTALASPRATPETAVEALESRLAGQTSELVRLRKHAETAQALLDLHTACTRQRTVVGTARQVAAVASAMTRAPIVVVSVFQSVSQQPLLAVSIGDGVVDEAQIGDVVCDVASQPDLAWLRTENRLRVVSPRDAGRRGGTVVVEIPADRSPSDVQRGLMAAGVVCDTRSERMRWSPGLVTQAAWLDVLDRELAGLCRS